MAVLDGSFNTETLSMSAVFRKLISSYQTPSTTYNGLELPPIVPKPRMVTCGEAPGEPLLMMFTPATLPCRDESAFCEASFEISAPFTEATDPVLSTLRWVP